MSDVQLGVTKDGGSCELVDISLIDSLAIVYSSSSSSSGHEGQSRPLWGVQFLRPGGTYGVGGDLSPLTYGRWIIPILTRGGGIFDNMPNQIHMYSYSHLIWKYSTWPVTQVVFCSFNNHCSVINHSDTFSLQCSWLKRVWILICYWKKNLLYV